MSKRPSKRARLEYDFDPDVLRAQLRESESCKKHLENAATLEPDESFGVHVVLAWAVLQCENIKDLSIICQVLKDAGHLGAAFVMKVLKELNHFTEKQQEASKTIVKHLIQMRHHFQGFGCSISQVLVTAKSTCICGEPLKSYETSFSTVNLYDVGSKTTNALLARIYCRKCNRSHGPWSIDQHKRATLNRKKSKQSIDSPPKRFYYEWKDVNYVEASETQYFTKKLCEQFATLL